MEFLPLWIVELGKSLSFPSRANPEASDRSKSLSPNFMAESIPQSACRYTGEFRGKYTGKCHNREPKPGSLVDRRAANYAIVSPIGRIVDVFGEGRVSSEQSGRSRPGAVIHVRHMPARKRSFRRAGGSTTAALLVATGPSHHSLLAAYARSARKNCRTSSTIGPGCSQNAK